MTDIKISELLEAGGLAGTELTPVVQGGNTVKATLADIAALATPAGDDTELQFNDGGSFGADSGLTFQKASKALSLTGPLTVTPASDAPAGTFRRQGSGQTSPILQVQSEANAVLASVDKVGLLTAAGATLTGHLTLSTKNLITDGTTGTKLGTATTQKLGFYNATPVVQPAAVADATDATDVITQLNALLARMRALGLIAT